MKISLSAFIAALAIITVVGQPARASSIQVNGTCEVGTCSSTDVLALGSSTNTPFNFTYEFADTDLFRLQGNLSTSNLQTNVSMLLSNFTVTYLGNNTGTVSGDDTLVNDFLQPVHLQTSEFFNANEALSGVFGKGLGSASSATAQAFFMGITLPVLGPFTPPPSDFLSTGNGSGFVALGTEPNDYRYTLTFGDGSQIGSSITVNPGPNEPSTVPEPGSLVRFGSGALGLIGALRRRFAA
jgi:hypothetical protein